MSIGRVGRVHSAALRAAVTGGRDRMKLRSSLLTVVVLALCAAPSSAGPQPPAGWKDGYVIANGIRIHYWQIGRAQSELQSPCNLVCRLLLEKKKKKEKKIAT